MKSLFLFFIMFTGAAAAGQRSLLSLPYESQAQSMTVSSLFAELEQRTGIVIEYASHVLDVQRVILLDGSEKSVGALLQKALDAQFVRVLEKNGKIILVGSEKPLQANTLLPRYRVYGFVKALESNEPLAEANIRVQHTARGMATNAHGFYSLLLTEGRHRVIITFAGFEPVMVDWDVRGHLRHDIAMQTRISDQQNVTVKSYAQRKGSSDKISADAQAPYSYFLGSHDPIRAAYLLPGVKNVPESFNGILVRGGGADENLFLLDGNPVYNPTHMLGALSIVNQTSLKTMRLYKSDFPARFSGALSSVMDVYTKDGHMHHWQAEADLGFLAAAATVEGPLRKGKTAMMGSFRHSWPTGFLKNFHREMLPGFQDLHVKLTHLLNSRNKFTLNFYNGKDQLKQDNEQFKKHYQWGNLLGSVAWHHVWGTNSFVNTSFHMSRYYNMGGFRYTLYGGAKDDSVLQERSLNTFSALRQYSAKSGSEIFISPHLKLNAGLRFSYTRIKPFETQVSEGLQQNSTGFGTFPALAFQEHAAYAEGEVRIRKRFFIRPGMHLSAYLFEQYRNLSIQPRIFASWRVRRNFSLYGSYSKMVQYLHLVVNPYLGANSNIWVPSTQLLQPERSHSWNLGMSGRNRKMFSFSLEGYIKNMRHVTNYAEGKSYFINAKNWENNIESGTGYCYGLESKLERNGKLLRFHAAYTLAWSWRRFQSMNGGEKFPYKYDRRHDLNMGTSWQFHKKAGIAVLWSYATGDRVTLPDQIYPDFDYAQSIDKPDDLLREYRFIYHFSGVNQYRTSAYQRLDFSVQYQPGKYRKVDSRIIAGVYNISGAPSQYAYDLRGSMRTRSIIIETIEGSFQMIPYLSVIAKF